MVTRCAGSAGKRSSRFLHSGKQRVLWVSLGAQSPLRIGTDALPCRRCVWHTQDRIGSAESPHGWTRSHSGTSQRELQPEPVERFGLETNQITQILTPGFMHWYNIEPWWILRFPLQMFPSFKSKNIENHYLSEEPLKNLIASKYGNANPQRIFGLGIHWELSLGSLSNHLKFLNESV